MIWFFPFLICQKFFIIRYEKHMKVLREMIDMMHCDIIIQKMIILESSFLEEGELLIHIFLLRLTLLLRWWTSSILSILSKFLSCYSLLFYSFLFCMQSFMLWCIISSLKKTDVSQKSLTPICPKLPAWWSLLKKLPLMSQFPISSWRFSPTVHHRRVALVQE